MRSSSILVCLLLLALSGCFNNGGGSSDADSTGTREAKADTGTSQGKDGKKKKPPKEKSIKVNISRIRQGELVLPVYADGAIRTPQSVQVKSKMGGQLIGVLVREGDQVQKGQLLARIDPREYQILLEENRYRHLLALSQIAAEIDTYVVDHEAQKNFSAAKRKLDRQKERGSLGEDEYQTRLIELEMTALRQGAFREEVLQQRTGLAEARMAEERARLNLDYTEIRAPFGGIVENLAVVEGEILSTGAIICSVVNNSKLEAVVNVLEADLGSLAEGRPALLAISATGDTLETIIDVISPMLEAATRTCQLILRFDNPEGRLRSGMFVRARIAGWVYHDRLMAPRDALLVRDSRTLVFKKEGDRAKWMYVDTGLENDDWVEILQVHSGGSLNPGDEVVVSDHLTLAHEAKIKVRKSLPSVDRWAFAEEAKAAKAAAVLYESRARLLELGRFEEAWDIGGEILVKYPDSPEAAWLLEQKASAAEAD
ncbi:MAG: efflux RND transporter periplasmic adaptor subunit [Candidatus Krumholzibacteria bacterium]|nr:efflux RND transporter periplasmic adaptor subunit [Candidatus Krumholzibacteria bacterium]